MKLLGTILKGVVTLGGTVPRLGSLILDLFTKSTSPEHGSVKKGVAGYTGLSLVILVTFEVLCAFGNPMACTAVEAMRFTQPQPQATVPQGDIETRIYYDDGRTFGDQSTKQGSEYGFLEIPSTDHSDHTYYHSDNLYHHSTSGSGSRSVMDSAITSFSSLVITPDTNGTGIGSRRTSFHS